MLFTISVFAILKQRNVKVALDISRYFTCPSPNLTLHYLEKRCSRTYVTYIKTRILVHLILLKVCRYYFVPIRRWCVCVPRVSGKVYKSARSRLHICSHSTFYSSLRTRVSGHGVNITKYSYEHETS